MSLSRKGIYDIANRATSDLEFEFPPLKFINIFTLNLQSSPHTVQFDAADVFGGIKEDLENVDNKRLAVMMDSIPGDMRSSYTQQCYPLYSLLQALGNPRQRGDLSLVGIS